MVEKIKFEYTIKDSDEKFIVKNENTVKYKGW